MTKNPMLLLGKNVIVTGASSGIGLATSRLVCELGGTVAMVSRSEERLRNAKKELPEDASKVFPFDLQKTKEIPDLVNFIRDKVGPVGGLVHSAGDFAVTPLRAFDPEEYRLLYDLHVTAFFMLSKAVCSKKNIDPSGASIVAVSSVTAVSGLEGSSTYSSVKGALVSAVRSLAVEYAAKGVRFNCVCPGWVNTPMLNRIKGLYSDPQLFDSAIAKRHLLGLGEPEDVANSICFLLSNAARWVTGASIILDGGYSV